MPTSPPSLLHSLVSPGSVIAPGRVDFKTAMDLLNLHSVFDVVRLSRNEFIEQLALHCDENAAHVYDHAVGYASQLEFLHREQGSLSRDHMRAKRDVSDPEKKEPTYAALFKEDWSTFCSPSSLAALDSPAAYLRGLYIFAKEVEKTGKGTQEKITLDERRPGFKELEINFHSLSSQVPMLTLVNETLNEQIQRHLADNSDMYTSQRVEEVLSEKRFPFQLPFNLAHQQCLSGLTSPKPMLGELNYRISLKLPLSQQPSNAYGVIQQEAYEAQRLLSGLSAQQQILLTSRCWSPLKTPQ